MRQTQLPHFLMPEYARKGALSALHTWLEKSVCEKEKEKEKDAYFADASLQKNGKDAMISINFVTQK